MLKPPRQSLYPKRWFISIKTTSRSCTPYSRVTSSLKRTTSDCSVCGGRHTTSKQNGSAADPWERWASIASGESTLFRGRFGTARKPPTVLRRSRGVFWTRRTQRIHTPLLGRSTNWPSWPILPWRKWVTGLRTRDSVCELQKWERGKSKLMYYTL